VTRSHAYYLGSDGLTNALYQVPIAGGTATKLATTSVYAVDDGHVYWADAEGRVYKMSM